MRKNISVTNKLVVNLLTNSNNASKLIEEALIYYIYAINNKLLEEQETNRIFAQGLIKIK